MPTITPLKDAEVTGVEQGSIDVQSANFVLAATGEYIDFTVPAGKKWSLKAFEFFGTIGAGVAVSAQFIVSDGAADITLSRQAFTGSNLNYNSTIPITLSAGQKLRSRITWTTAPTSATVNVLINVSDA